VVEQILRAVDKHFKGVCHTQSDLTLVMKLFLQIRQQRHLFDRRFILNKVLVNTLYALVNDRAFFRRQTVTTADNDLTKRNQKIGLIGDNFHRIAEKIIINGYIHWIDMLFTV